jgi:hypothetical protein
MSSLHRESDEISSEQVNRTIQAAWLEELAQYPDRVASAPIYIDNAIIEGDLDLTYATFQYQVVITNSEFTDKVDAVKTSGSFVRFN